MHVFLSACGNPDLGQGPELGIRSEWREVASFEEASRACLAFIHEYALGGGNWSGGQVCDRPGGRLVARVSYNGRVWPPQPWSPGQESLWDPPLVESGGSWR